MEAMLALEDGRVFRGRSFGAPGERSGEVVFNTSMTGYQEVLTDPSYRGQIVAMTCPLIGNCGVNEQDVESDRPQIEAFIVREVSEVHSNWRSRKDLPQYLRENRIPAISEVDTRALTLHIRSRGAMRGVVATGANAAEDLVRRAQQAVPLGRQDLVGQVTCAAPYVWSERRDPIWNAGEATDAGAPRPRRRRVVAFDLGIKRNILRYFADSDCEVTVVPAGLSAAAALDLRPDGVFLSNGPGDPEQCAAVVDTVRGLIGKVPLFGICLGHQVLGLALGASTFKLKFGHRGGNQPVKDLTSGRIAITAQNHGYAVDPHSLPASVETTHVNLNDGTCEGFRHRELPVFAVQYHPESSPGPHDADDLFRRFLLLMDGERPAAGVTGDPATDLARQISDSKGRRDGRGGA